MRSLPTCASSLALNLTAPIANIKIGSKRLRPQLKRARWSPPLRSHDALNFLPERKATPSVMANAGLRQLSRACLQDEAAFRFLSLPLEIRNMVYAYTIFSDDSPEFFVVNPKIDLSLLQVSRIVSSEVSMILYTTRVAVIALLPHQYYLHGRPEPVKQLFRSDEEEESTIRKHDIEDQPSSPSPGLIHPRTLAKFSNIRLCLFFPATFQRAYPLMFFDPIAELKRVLEALGTHDAGFPGKSAARARGFLEIIIAVYPRPEDEEVETAREARIREDFVGRGITGELRRVTARRTLKVGGNFTKEGLVRFCRVTCGE